MRPTMWNRLRPGRSDGPGTGSAQDSRETEVQDTSLSPSGSGREVGHIRRRSKDSRKSELSNFDVGGMVKNVGSNHSRERSNDRRADPMGLNVLYSPTDSTLSANIIFIHGLGGTSRQTWSWNRDLEYCWPANWLPKEPELSSVRILSFGYNAHFSQTKEANMSNITDFAKSLLFQMKYGEDNDLENFDLGNSPTIFVVHSMGGLVFKRAYMMGMGNLEYKDIVSSIRSVVFLSTPHRGTQLAEVLNKILSASVFGHSTKQYINDLSSNSTALEDLNENFRHVATELKIFSFYETLKTTIGPRSIMVLEKDSSVLGYPGEVSQPLNADHHSVCKYESTADPNYKSVRAVLKKMVADLTDNVVVQDSERQDPEMAMDDFAKVEDVLALQEAPEDDLAVSFDRWTSGTCEWIWSHHTFKTWSEITTKSSVLWIHALPGSGKSTMCSYLINRYLEDQQNCSFFYFKYGDSSKRSANTLFRSIALQIALQVPEFEQAIHTMFEEGVRLEKADARMIWQKLFVGVLFKLRLDHPLYWVLDALDESDSAQNILDLISSIRNSLTPIHIIVFSRNLTSISKAFGRIGGKLPLTILCADQSTQQDIHHHVRKEVDDMHGDDEFKEEIVAKIVSKADGSFLWASLALMEIIYCHNQEDVERVFEELPQGMESMYRRMEDSISSLGRPTDKAMARTILMWATYAQRPLSTVELTEALKPEFSKILDVRFTIDSVCGNLVVVDQRDRVQLIHQTAREYLVSASNLPFPFDPASSHEALFEKSISIFLGRNVRPRLQQNPLPPFLAYAAASWPHHFKHVSVQSDQALTTLVKFLKGTYVLPWIQAIAQLKMLKVLVSTSQSFVNFNRKRRRYDSNRMPLLHRLSDIEVLEAWAVDLLKLVGKFGGNLLDMPSTIHKQIPQYCPGSSIMNRQFARTNPSFSIAGITHLDWDDSIARVSVGTNHQAAMICCAGRFITVLTSAGTIVVWDAITFEQLRILAQKEHVFTMCLNTGGSVLAAFGFVTTKLWNVSNGELLHEIPNPPGSKALSMSFAEDESALLVGSATREILRLSLTEPNDGWVLLQESLLQEEIFIEGAYLNAPMDLVFDADALHVAVAYRGAPMSVWNLELAEPINRLKRKTSGFTAGTQWTGTLRAVWHPSNEDVLGIFSDSVVFRWNPHDDSYQELKHEPNSGIAQEIQCSPDGRIFATSDANGTIKLYDYEHFALLYQLSSQNTVTALCFSPDGRRLYDLRASFCTAWEPNALIRLSESDEHVSDTDTEIQSMTISYIASEAVVESPPPIIGLAIQPQGKLLCSGNDEGLVELHDATTLKKTEIGQSATGLGVDHLTWSEDGQYLAYVELGGRLVVKFVLPSDASRSSFAWKPVSLFSKKTGLGARRIHQLLFSPDSKWVLVAYQGGAQIWSLESKAISKNYVAPHHQPRETWTNNPTDASQLMAFTAQTMSVLSWESFESLRRWRIPASSISPDYFSAKEPGLFSELSLTSPLSPQNTAIVVDKIIPTHSQGYLILHLTLESGFSKRSSSFIVIDMSSTDFSIDSTSTADTKDLSKLSVVAIPPEISNMIVRPIDIIGKDQLVFLDRSHWVCTWSIKTRHASVGGLRVTPGSISTNNALVQHFFLPRDWVDPESIELCRVTAEGIFFCPYRGEIAAIRSEIMDAW